MKRGALSTSAAGRKFIYHPEIAEKIAMEETSTALFDHLCAMKKGGVLVNLVAETELSQTDIQQLQDLLAAKAKTAPEQVACDCLGLITNKIVLAVRRRQQMIKIMVLVIGVALIGFIAWWFFGKHEVATEVADVSEQGQSVDITVQGAIRPKWWN